MYFNGDTNNRIERNLVINGANDGIEIRWGAPEHSNEMATCLRRAPSAQREKMQSVRKWFKERLHPPT